LIDDGGISSVNIYKESIEPVLVSLSNLYSLLKSISVSISRPSFYPTLHFLLATSTNYYLKEIIDDFSGLRRPFYSKQDFKDACCSLT